jgi:thiosulfate/3-mercaptopyruvate sulfurtransferase
VGDDENFSIFEGDRSVIASSDSGMTAAIIWLGLNMISAPNVAIYDEASVLFV